MFKFYKFIICISFTFNLFYKKIYSRFFITIYDWSICIIYKIIYFEVVYQVALLFCLDHELEESSPKESSIEESSPKESSIEESSPKESSKEDQSSKLFFWSPARYWNTKLLDLVDYIVWWCKLDPINFLIFIIITFIVLMISNFSIRAYYKFSKDYCDWSFAFPIEKRDPNSLFSTNLPGNGFRSKKIRLKYLLKEIELFFKTL